SLLDSSLPAVKAALHRGRTRLREIAAEPDDRPLPVLAAAERSRLADYASRFNARGFYRLRHLLADPRPLELRSRVLPPARGGAARCRITLAATAAVRTGSCCPAWLRAGRRSSCAIPQRAKSSISSCWPGTATASATSGISAMPVTRWRAPSFLSRSDRYDIA